MPRAPAGAGDLRLSIANGRVTLVAQDVSLRQILDEWARVGQTKIVGAEQLTGPSVTLELTDVPEGRALEMLLRSASGYIAKPRSGTVGASSFDRILIMPASRPPAMSAAAPHRSTARPQPQVVMPNVVIDDDNEPNGDHAAGHAAAAAAVPRSAADAARHAAGTGRARDADADASGHAAAAGAERPGQSVSDQPAAAEHPSAGSAGPGRTRR